MFHCGRPRASPRENRQRVARSRGRGVRSASMPEGSATIAERVARRLAHTLGPHTARVAVKTFTQRALGRGPETLAIADIVPLANALKPMLRTLLGKQRGETVAAQILREFGL